jgi:beta-glucosidase
MVLAGFERVAVKSMESVSVTIKLTDRSVSTWSTTLGAWGKVPGTFKVFVGASSADVRLTGSFVV